MNGSEYEIEIYGMTDEDMIDITSALFEAGVAGDDRDGIGTYLRDGRGNSVFVDPSDVGEAVKIINALGFSTDEDEQEDEELDF